VNARAVRIAVQGGELEGDLTIPERASGIVLFAHGSGSSRHSRRNIYVARGLQHAGLATLLFDLLLEREAIEDERTGVYRFDIGLLAERLIDATHWTRNDPATAALPLGYFGASTGAAAALVAAAQEQDIAAIVSRGGRPDLAGSALPMVRAPTLLIVGGNDELVIDLNRQALQLLGSVHKDLVIVPGATHLFEEPGALDQVIRLATDWFLRHASLSGSLQRADRWHQ
jgi:dienelactone hydrolase